MIFGDRLACLYTSVSHKGHDLKNLLFYLYRELCINENPVESVNMAGDNGKKRLFPLINNSP